MEPKNEAHEYFDVGATSFVGLMNELVDIRGYLASAIMSYDGGVLYSNSIDRKKDYNFSAMIRLLDVLFGKACVFTEKSGFFSCSELSLKTSEEVMLVRCSGEDCLVGIRIFVLVEEQGNVVLMQRRLRYLLPLIMRCLTWEPDHLVPLFMSEAAGRKKREGTRPGGEVVKLMVPPPAKMRPEIACQ